MEDMLNVAEAKTRLIQELSEITGFKYLKSGVLKKTVKDIVFEIYFFSSKSASMVSVSSGMINAQAI